MGRQSLPTWMADVCEKMLVILLLDFSYLNFSLTREFGRWLSSAWSLNTVGGNLLSWPGRVQRQWLSACDPGAVKSPSFLYWVHKIKAIFVILRFDFSILILWLVCRGLLQKSHDAFYGNRLVARVCKKSHCPSLRPTLKKYAKKEKTMRHCYTFLVFWKL